MEHNKHEHSHHVIPYSMLFKMGGALLVLTVITVAIARVDLGILNFPIALLVATIKASIVGLIFMGLFYDKRENGVIFASSFIFLAIFIGLTAVDLFSRGDVYQKRPFAMAAATVSKIKDPHLTTPELIGKGKELFAQQCVSCHGTNGMGDGPAAAALKPAPRNFHANEGWKNGRTVPGIFKTLREGIQGGAMGSFATLSPDDRWALTHYVISLNSAPVAEAKAEDFKAAGIDLSGAADQTVKEIPLDQAIAAITSGHSNPEAKLYAVSAATDEESESPIQRVYRMECARCHGDQGQGGVKVSLSGAPGTQVIVRPMRSLLSDYASFEKAVTQGIPGGIMPSSAHLSAAEIRELYSVSSR